MSTITRERALQIFLGNGPETTASEERELARIALASLEAELYGYVHKAAYEQAGSCGLSSDHEAYRDSSTHVAVYTAPPAPVSVPDELPPHEDESYGSEDDCYKAGRVEGWNACRAAMLQGAEHVTAAYKLPANTPCKDAPEHIWLQTAGVWPENGEFSELTWCSDNQHPDDTLYVRADVVSGNSPVLPDGWVACSERMPETYVNVLLTDEHDDVCIGQMEF